MSLREKLAAEIAAGGPLTVAQYMTACLHDPAFGYYATRPALGEAGDFITAPLVSQMFGELIGLWAVECWVRLGRPSRVRLVEAGPGDGALMSDMLRAARLAPDFVAAAEVWLVEVSEPLRAAQRAKLGEAVRWAASLKEVPDGAPMILVANELLDCLPARQWVRTEKGWAERLVTAGEDGALAFALGGQAPPFPTAWDARPGEVMEVSPAQEAFADQLGHRIARDGGAALLIDYGRSESGPGDTLQALRRHEKVDPLACPGEADLTVHADFPKVLAAARGQGAATALLTQGEFLRRLGIEARASALARARPDRAATIGRQLERLVAADEMGELFKAACIHSPGWTPPGFEASA
jgi:NADH dehydrogenase [ubiquinone] 1 alpha subcomplex assembly factor 7